MRIARAGHGNRIAFVFHAAAGFERNGIMGGLLTKLLGKAAPLNHESRNHSMKDGVFVKAFAHISEEVLHRNGGAVGREADNDIAQSGVDFNKLLFAGGSKRSKRQQDAETILHVDWEMSKGKTADPHWNPRSGVNDECAQCIVSVR